MNGKYVTYLRVSTARQGQSGLGLEAQRAAVRDYLASVGGESVGEFLEVESGKNDHRPELTAALAVCRKKKATLLIAKLDRLSRNVHFITGLMETGVPFVAADCPNDDRMMLQIRAVFAEEERRKISERTRQALAAARDRGVKLGSPVPASGSRAGVASLRAGADQFASNVLPVIESVRSAGCVSLQQIAVALSARGIRTARGGEWTATAVRRVLGRVA